VPPIWVAPHTFPDEPIEVQSWLRELRKQRSLSKSTLIKVRNIMLVVFKHGKRYGFLSRAQESNPMVFVRQSCVSDFEPIVLTFSHCVDIVSI
jgi:hypothetical protein